MCRAGKLGEIENAPKETIVCERDRKFEERKSMWKVWKNGKFSIQNTSTNGNFLRNSLQSFPSNDNEQVFRRGKYNCAIKVYQGISR